VIRALLPFLVLCAAAPVAAQSVDPASSPDSRIQVIDYDAGRTVELRVAVGYQVAVELGRDEQAQNIAVGNSAAWQVSVNARRNLVFVKPTQDASTTNMTVFTTLRTYTFELRALPAMTADMPFTIRFRSAETSPNPALDPNGFVDLSAAQRRASRYRVTGDAALKPDSVSHDSQFTYVTWPKERDLPATYEISATGQELLVNGIMRDDVLVIDRVLTKLRFRRDRNMAQAELVQDRRKR
jgi:type IV secretion system protein VirB9